MEKLVILNYTTGTVHFYDVEDNIEVDEEYIENLGHNSKDCYYMVGNLEIIYHKD